MKQRIALLAAVLLIMASACTKIIPVADFTYDVESPVIYDVVTFTNTTVDGESYSWDFGDGETSTEMSPTHQFQAPGTYSVTLTATAEDGTHSASKDVTVAAYNSSYSLDGTEYAITDTMFWYSMGGSTYIRLLVDIPGQENQDLIKLFPNQGVNELPGTYTWDAENPEGTYDAGYTKNYAGMNFDWTAIGAEGCSDLVIEEVYPEVYKITASVFELGTGNYDWTTGELIIDGAATITDLDYLGTIKPL